MSAAVKKSELKHLRRRAGQYWAGKQNSALQQTSSLKISKIDQISIKNVSQILKKEF